MNDSTPELRKFPFGVLAAQPEEVRRGRKGKERWGGFVGIFVWKSNKKRKWFGCLCFLMFLLERFGPLKMCLKMFKDSKDQKHVS